MDCAAATAGIPLYGLYHTNGDLKIRINECGSGNPPTTTTTTTASGGGPGTSGARYALTDCNTGATYYIAQDVYCDNDNNFAVTPGGAYGIGDVVQYRRSTNCTGATYCGTITSSSTGTWTGLVSALLLPFDCDANVCSQ